MLLDTEFKGEGPAPSGSGPPLLLRANLPIQQGTRFFSACLSKRLSPSKFFHSLTDFAVHSRISRRTLAQVRIDVGAVVVVITNAAVEARVVRLAPMDLGGCGRKKIK